MQFQYSRYVDRKQNFHYGLILTRQLLKLLRDMEMTQLGCWDHWNVIDHDGWMYAWLSGFRTCMSRYLPHKPISAEQRS